MQNLIVNQAGPLQYLTQHILPMLHLQMTNFFGLSRGTDHDVQPCQHAVFRALPPAQAQLQQDRVVQKSFLTFGSTQSWMPVWCGSPVAWKAWITMCFWCAAIGILSLRMCQSTSMMHFWHCLRPRPVELFSKIPWCEVLLTPACGTSGVCCRHSSTNPHSKLQHKKIQLAKNIMEAAIYKLQ